MERKNKKRFTAKSDPEYSRQGRNGS
jgi:hypothetical protein